MSCSRTQQLQENTWGPKCSFTLQKICNRIKNVWSGSAHPRRRKNVKPARSPLPPPARPPPSHLLASWHPHASRLVGNFQAPQFKDCRRFDLGAHDDVDRDAPRAFGGISSPGGVGGGTKGQGRIWVELEGAVEDEEDGLRGRSVRIGERENGRRGGPTYDRSKNRKDVAVTKAIFLFSWGKRKEGRERCG